MNVETCEHGAAVGYCWQCYKAEVERLKKSANQWEETALTYAKNSDYWQGKYDPGGEPMTDEAKDERTQAEWIADIARSMEKEMNDLKAEVERLQDEFTKERTANARNVLRAIRLREALEEWECPRCVGKGWWATKEGVKMPCLNCEETGLHPIAYRALASGEETHCGHPHSSIASSDEGTTYCAECEREARGEEKGYVTCPRCHTTFSKDEEFLHINGMVECPACEAVTPHEQWEEEEEEEE